MIMVNQHIPHRISGNKWEHVGIQNHPSPLELSHTLAHAQLRRSPAQVRMDLVLAKVCVICGVFIFTPSILYWKKIMLQRILIWVDVYILCKPQDTNTMSRKKPQSSCLQLYMRGEALLVKNTIFEIYWAQSCSSSINPQFQIA